MIHIIQEWLQFSHAVPSEPPLWPLVLATIMASSMILSRQTRDRD